MNPTQPNPPRARQPRRPLRRSHNDGDELHCHAETRRPSRTLAVLLLVLAIAVGLAGLLLPFVLLHRHYDRAIETMRPASSAFVALPRRRPRISRRWRRCARWTAAVSI